MVDLPQAPSVDINAEFNAAQQSAALPLPPGPAAPVAQPLNPDQQALNVISNAPVNVINPEGKLVSINGPDLQEALNMGYRTASPEEVQKATDEETYGTPGQQLATGLEGAASAATFGLSTGIERAIGIDPESIVKRRETNPIAHATGQVAGLIGSAALVPGGGAAGLLEGAGAMGAKALGLGAAQTTAAKIGSAAVKASIENMVFQGGDEVAKMIALDPNQSAQTAIADIGLAGVIGGAAGGALGSVNPLWQAAKGSQTGGFLSAIARKMGGIENTVPDAVADAIETAGINVAPEIKAALSSDPAIRQAFQVLQESSTTSGMKAQEALKTFRNDIGTSIANTLGKTPEEIAGLSDLSVNEIGSAVKDDLVKSLKNTFDPISEQFDKVRNKFKGVGLDDTAKVDISQKLGDLMVTEGYSLSADAAQSKLLNRVLKDLSGLNTLEDIRKYTSLIGDETAGIAKQELWKVGREIKGILRDAEDSVLTKAIGDKAPELLSEHATARGAYRDAMNIIDTLNERLHAGSHAGPKTFIKNVAEMDAKDVLSRLNPRGKVEVINELTELFPEVASKVKDYHVSELLKTASNKAQPGELLNYKSLFTALDKMTPEMRQFLMGAESSAKIDALRQLTEALPAKMNNSGTAKALDALMSHAPGSATALGAMVFGHNPVAGAILGYGAKMLARDVPDAVRLSMLKFLGSDKTINSGGFKAMTDYIHHTMQGENLVGKSVTNLFKAGGKVLPQMAIPSDRVLANLDKALKVAQTDPNSLLNVGGSVGHYMPDHSSGMSQTVANAVNYINSQRPNTDQKAPLDSKLPPSAAEAAKFKNVLTIAQQPLSVLEKVKAGNITVQDVNALRTMYPDLYTKLSAKVMDHVIDLNTQGKNIPYATRQGLSIFLGQPLDSTMKPQAIMNAQPVSMDQQQQQGAPAPKRSTASLSKMPGMYKTQGQKAEANQRGEH